MASRLFVGNIPPDTKEDDLSKEFGFYGNVQNVEIKEKKGIDDNLANNKFAFITIEADIFNINKCIKEFSDQKWNGHFLNVSIAKESFMDRLKRERLEAIKNKSPQIPDNKTTTQNKQDYVVNIRPDKKSFIQTDENDGNESYNNFENRKTYDKQESYENEKRYGNHDNYKQYDNYENDNGYEQDNNYGNRKKNNFESKRSSNSFDFQISNDQNDASLENNLANEKNSSEVKKRNKPKRPKEKKPVNVSKVQNEIDPNLSAADKKRLESMQNMRNAYKEKKSAIKIALSHVDKNANKKIKFDDSGDVLVEKTDEKNVPDAKRNKMFDNGEKNLKPKDKRLFDEASSDEDEYNFDVKQQFQGESGQKLLELQSRYKSDKRFVLDERFIDDSNAHDENGIEAIDSVEENEKTRQMQILEGIIGVSMTRKGHNDPSGNKKAPIKTMLRYDPTRTDHEKFINPVVEKSETSKKSKKQKKKNEINSTEDDKIVNNPAPEVSQERYYKVNESLKKTMDEKQPFSLLSLFGSKDVEESNANNDDEYETKDIKASKSSVKNPMGGKENPFFYDTSDTDEETTNKPTKKVAENPIENKPEPTLTMEVEDLFFSDNDPRLTDGLNFFIREKPTANKSRDELKFIVKKRIQNNKRNDIFQSKKGSHRSFNTVKFKKR